VITPETGTARGGAVAEPPSISTPISVGTVLRHTRRYTAADFAVFDDLAGLESTKIPDLLPDILVIAPLTKLGGDLNYISRHMSWTMTGTAAADEAVTAELEVVHLDDSGSTIKITFTGRIRNAAGEVIVTAESNGIILRA
jgi:hypothetical protein